MAELEALVFRVGMVMLALGSVGFVVTAVRHGGAETRKFYLVMALAAGITAVIYAAMAVGIGAMTVAIDGMTRTVYWVRAGAWLAVGWLTAMALWWLAGSDGPTLLGLLGSATIIVGASAAAALVADPVLGLGQTGTAIAIVGVATVGLLMLLGVLFHRLSTQAGRQTSAVGILFSIVRNVVVLIWVLYLVTWTAGAVLGVLGVGATAVAFLVLDAAGTIGIGALLLRDDSTLAQAVQ